MTFPSQVAYTGSIIWPTQRNANLGPFEVAHGGTTYTVAFAPDYTAASERVRVYVSEDLGHVFSERDGGNAPPILITASHRHLCVYQDDTTFYVYVPGGASLCDIHVFDLTTLTWGTTLVGPAITWSIQGGTGHTMLWAFHRTDGSHVIAAQVPTETVGTAFRRCALYYGSPGSWVGPLYLSTGTSSLPGVAAHHDLLYGILGDAGRIHLFWADANIVQSRTFNADNSFGMTVNLGTPVNLASSRFAAGIGCRYEDSGLGIAALFASNISPNINANIARVNSLTSDTLANWTVTTASASGGQSLNVNPGAVLSDGSDWFFLLRVRQDYSLDYSEDGGTDTWSDFVEWKGENTFNAYGMSANFLTLTNRIGYLYYNNPGAGTRGVLFDCIHVYHSNASRGIGTYTTEQSLGVEGVPDYLIQFNSTAAGAGISVIIEVRTRQNDGSSWGDPVLSLGSEDADGKDLAHTGPLSGYIQITETVSGGTMAGAAVGIG